MSFYVVETQPELTKEHYDLAKVNGISKATLYKRVKKLGWSIEKAINDQVLSQSEITERAAAATPFRETNSLHFLKEVEG